MHQRVQLGHVVPVTGKDRDVADPVGVSRRRPECIGSFRIDRSDHQQPDPGELSSQRPYRVEQLEDAFFRHQPADKADDLLVGRQPELAPRRFETGRIHGGAVESAHVDAVADVFDPAGRTDALLNGGVDVLAVLRQQRVRQPRQRALEQHPRRALQARRVVVKVKPVHRVDDERDACEPRGQLRKHRRLHLVGMHDGESARGETAATARSNAVRSAIGVMRLVNGTAKCGTPARCTGSRSGPAADAAATSNPASLNQRS